VTDDIASKLDEFISIGERVASSLEAIEREFANVASDVSSIGTDVSVVGSDVSTSETYAYSMKLDLDSIRSTVDAIHIEVM